MKQNLDYCRSYPDTLLRKFLDRNEDVFKTLRRIALIRYCGVNYHPCVFAFVIPLDVISPQFSPIRPKYIFAIYAKVPSRTLLYVSDEIFSDLSRAKEQSQYYLNYFPLYARLSRNIYRKHNESSL
jgi:hypothetical protein